MKKNSLSFRIIKQVLFFCLVLGCVIFTIYYIFYRTTIEKATRQNAIHLANNTVARIEQVVNPAEKIPENLAWMLETGALPKDSIESFLSRLVKNNTEIFASAIAFEPHVLAEGVTAYAPFAYRSGDSIKTTDLWSPGYNYFIMDWYQIPAILKEPYW